MSEEYLDIVDESGNLTGEKELRSICHVRGLWHRTVHIYLFRKNNGKIELLTHQRSFKKDTSPGKWTTSFGGHVTSGQIPDEAMLTEIEEEIGLEMALEDFIEGFRGKYVQGTNREHVTISYLPYYEDISKLTFNDGEVEQVNWMSFDEIEKALLDNPSQWSKNSKDLGIIKEDLLRKID